VTPVTAELAAYLSRQTLQVPVADVSGFVLSPGEGAMTETHDRAAPSSAPLASGSVRLVRTLDGWRYKPEHGPLKTPSAEAAAQVDALLGLLCEEPADASGLETLTGTVGVALVTLESGQRVVIGAAEVPVPGKGAETVLVARAGRVFRVYRGAGVAGLLQWLREELPPEG
jgi:hypothetical protein